MKKISVVGFGFMGRTHTMNILKNKDLKLMAIVDKNQDLIDGNLNLNSGNISIGDITAVKLSGINKYTDLDSCLKSEDVDAVIICVHTGLHYEMTKKALSSGKHVFLEKPICLDLNQGEELITLAEKQRKILMVGHVVRFMSPYQKLKQWIDSKEFGALRFLSLTRFCGQPEWGQWMEKQVIETSGGALFDLVIHDIDFASFAVGFPDHIQSNYLPGGMSKHDYISAMWSYRDSDVHVRIEGGNIFHKKFPFQAGYMARFDKTSILYTTMNSEVIRITDDKNIREIPAGDASAGYLNEMDYFGKCINSNMQPHECMPDSSLQSIKLCYKHILS